MPYNTGGQRWPLVMDVYRGTTELHFILLCKVYNSGNSSFIKLIGG